MEELPHGRGVTTLSIRKLREPNDTERLQLLERVNALRFEEMIITSRIIGEIRYFYILGINFHTLIKYLEHYTA